MLRRIGRILLFTFGGLLAVLLAGPFLIPVRPLSGLPEAHTLAGPESRFATVPFPGTDGIDLHYREAGSGEPVFVLLHGFNYNLTTWDNVFDFFASYGYAVAYDRIPFGLSERLTDDDWEGPNPYTPAAEQQQLVALLDVLGVEQAVLVGNSAGGQAAVEFTRDYPERVAGLILVDAAIYRGGVPPWADWIIQSPQLDRIGPLIVRRFGRNDLFNDIGYVREGQPSAESRRDSELTFKVKDWDFALWEFQVATGPPPELEPVLPRLDVPTLLIHGEADRIVPIEESVRAAEAIPDATLVRLPDCGHFPQDECPAGFTAAVADWLARREAELAP